jgi:hypothetical protein
MTWLAHPLDCTARRTNDYKVLEAVHFASIITVCGRSYLREGAPLQS